MNIYERSEELVFNFSERSQHLGLIVTNFSKLNLIRVAKFITKNQNFENL